MEKIPKIGIGVLIKKDGKVLMGERKNAHGDSTWAPSGGHLEFNETIFECATREVTEETGLKVTNLQKGFFSEDFYEVENKHYLTFIVSADWESGEPEPLETRKMYRMEVV